MVDVGDIAFARSVVERITYKPGYRFKVESQGEGTYWRYLILWVTSDEIDSRTGEPKADFERWIELPFTDSEESIVAQVRALLKEIELHEMNEWLRLDGEIVHDPHVCIDCRVEANYKTLVPAHRKGRGQEGSTADESNFIDLDNPGPRGSEQSRPLGVQDHD